MSNKPNSLLILLSGVLIAILVGWNGTGSSMASPTSCQSLTDPNEIPAAVMIDFDILNDQDVIGTFYQPDFGVTFENNRTAQAVIDGQAVGPFSAPNVVFNLTSGSNANYPMTVGFDVPQTWVGFYIGGGTPDVITATLRVFDADGNELCATSYSSVPETHSQFLGVYDSTGMIYSFTLDYGNTEIGESMDNLYFSQELVAPTPSPTATQTATFTPTPTSSSTPTPTATAASQQPSEIFFFPDQAAPGANLSISGYGFPPGERLTLMILPIDVGGGGELGNATTNPDGTFQQVFALPFLDAGVYEVAVTSPSTLSAADLLTILPAPTLVLNSDSGAPGKVVSFTVTGLAAGFLRLDYAGVPVKGPVAVAAGTYNGSFVVPNDRPDPLGSSVVVRAVNLVNNQVVGAAETAFLSKTPNAPPNYSFSQINLPGGALGAGEVFTITGQISPPPVGALSGYSLKALWKTSSGKVFPIDNGKGQVFANGSFNIPAFVPSILNGSPQVAESNGQVGVVLIKKQNPGPQVFSGITPFGPLKPRPNFVIKVVDGTGQPIPDVIVDIRAPVSSNQVTGPLSASQSFSASNLQVNTNQISNLLGTSLDPGKSDPFNCSTSPGYGRTDQNGLFPVTFDEEFIAMMGQKISLGYVGPKEQFIQQPMEITFPLYVNGLYQGFGLDGKPQIFTLNIKFSAFTNQFYDADKEKLLNTNPLLVTLKAMPVGTKIEMPVQLNVPEAKLFAKFDNYVGTGIPLWAFGKYLGFPDKTTFPDSVFSFTGGVPVLRVEFFHNPQAYGALDESSLTLSILGKSYPFKPVLNNSSPEDQCKGVLYRADVPNLHRFSPGNPLGLVQVKDATGFVTKRYIQAVIGSPPSWIGNTNLPNRKIYYPSSNQKSISMFADLSGNSTLNANVNKVGPLNNAAGTVATTGQAIYLNGNVQNYTQMLLVAETLNTTTKTNLVPNGGGFVKITIPQETYTILDTGRMPLFRDVWGIPPIASATISADMWFNATLTKEGEIILDPINGVMNQTLFIKPEATVGVEAKFEASAVFGLASAEASAIPQISLSMPVEIKNGNVDDKDNCFKYKLDIKWSAQVGVCPFCLSDSGTENIFKGHVPTDADPKICADPKAPVFTLAPAASPSPPAAKPSVATDGLGHILAVYRTESGDIAAKQYINGGWLPPVTITGNHASLAPKVVFYAPKQAIAVWAQSSLTAEESQAATFDQRVSAQHLAYALWNGTTWGSSKNLTMPTTGEGDVALAGCLSTNPACLAGGQVTVVWIRDVAGDLSQRKLRLYYRTFNGSAWSTTAAVDSTSTATDSEPEVVYQNGIPLVAWVRDTDRSLGTLADRKLVYRTLPSGSLTVTAGLPAAVTEPSLAVDPQGHLRLAFTVATDPQAFMGNQRQLYSAAQTCSPACSWSVQALVDAHNRPIHAEGPALTLDPYGMGTITYRALGFGPLAGGYQTFPEDAVGVILGTGEVAQVEVNFLGSTFAPHYLTNDGLTKWQVASVFDPLSNQTLALTAVSSAASLAGTQLTRATAAEPVTSLAAPRVVDFAIAAIIPETFYPQAGAPFSTQIVVRNDGILPPEAADQPVSLFATWDGPQGIGSPAGSLNFSSLSGGQVITLTLDVSLPVSPELPHDLFVTVNPLLSIPETSLGNNSQNILIGGLPVPETISVSVKTGSSLVFLEWDPVDDSRVIGYRVYRAGLDGIFQPVGSTFVNGYVDLTASLDKRYTYAVTSFIGNGVESSLSTPVDVLLSSFRIYIPVVNRR